MVPLLTFLREVGVVPVPQVSASPVESMLGRYRSWMESERGLSASTMLRYENTARRFLAEQAMAGGVFAPDGLTGVDLNVFLLRECARVSAGSAKGRVAELRSLMRFLHLHGVTAIKLGGAVPPVGGWRFASVPPTMAPGDVQRLLEHTSRRGRSASVSTATSCRRAVRISYEDTTLPGYMFLAQDQDLRVGGQLPGGGVVEDQRDWQRQFGRPA
jgi:hypothetical protein